MTGVSKTPLFTQPNPSFLMWQECLKLNCRFTQPIYGKWTLRPIYSGQSHTRDEYTSPDLGQGQAGLLVCIHRYLREDQSAEEKVIGDSNRDASTAGIRALTADLRSHLESKPLITNTDHLSAQICDHRWGGFTLTLLLWGRPQHWQFEKFWFCTIWPKTKTFKGMCLCFVSEGKTLIRAQHALGKTRPKTTDFLRLSG